MERKERKIIPIFWTGGYDSTFRVVALSRCDVSIQPIYMSDKRPSEDLELKAIKEITSLLLKHPDTKAEILPLQIIGYDEREDDKEYREAYDRIYQKDFVGPQYIWLGVFAEKNPNIEMSIHKDDKAISIILKYGKLKKVTDCLIGDYYVVDKENSPEDITKLWGNLHFPLVYITKKEMRDFYKEHGYSEVASKTWFCYRPINGKPCGMCNPCKYTIEEGLKERFTKMALARYHCKKILVKIRDFIFNKK